MNIFLCISPSSTHEIKTKSIYDDGITSAISDSRELRIIVDDLIAAPVAFEYLYDEDEIWDWTKI